MRTPLTALILVAIPMFAQADVASLRADAKRVQMLGDELSAARATLAQRKGTLTEDIAAFNASCHDSDSDGCESVRAELRKRQEHLNTEIRAWDARRREYLERRRELERRAGEVAGTLAGTPPADLEAPAPGLVRSFAASDDRILEAGERRHVELRLLRSALAIAATRVARALLDRDAPVIVGVKLTRWWPDERAEWWAETPVVRRIRREEVGVEGSAAPPTMQIYAVEATDYTTPAGSFTVGENGAEKLKVKWPPSVPKPLTSPISPGATVSADEIELSLSAGVPSWSPIGGSMKVYAKQKWMRGGR